tara:strand:+ start:299 stop:664 length:366 start_codon:yes stop_codon:yes gene_type:complete
MKIHLWFSVVLVISVLYGCDGGVETESLKSFGQAQFSKESWSNSGQEERSKMIYSFLQSNKPIQNLSRDQVIDQLGDSTSYYQYDEFPAYEISQDSTVYTLAFVIDRNTAKVKGIELEKMP